jgi:hypothetical protein
VSLVANIVASLAAAVAFNANPPRCDQGEPDCATASGPILALERVDPDGDGDAHFVVLDPGGVTAPGISVIDVATELRPQPLPRAGTVISAAGPVLPGSYGQRQIQATEIRVGPG